MCLPVFALTDTYTLSAEAWAQPRSADRVVQLPAVAQVIESWMQAGGAVIEIRYPGGEAGSLWALELRDWLVALGIPSNQIVVQMGSPNIDELIMQITQQRQ